MFQKMDINTKDVLDAAATKWNFQRLSPGLVGGYCIPVVPYFLVQKAEEAGYHPQIILAGRTVNDHMPKHVAEMMIKSINQTGKVIKGSKVLIIGCTYKANVSDTRETPIRNVIRELREYGIEIYGYDPLVKNGERDLGITFIKSSEEAPKMDGVILAVAHDIFKGISLNTIKSISNPLPAIIDLTGTLDMPEIYNSGVLYKRL
jgi:UDP-N-acetyl-D-glucosamine/UDP-N-acetyl-D-galactosamine dehydrogenase